MIMKVYSWWQFWNDFNNWDEGLFQDANRPRDDDKFKLRPWLQSDKRKQREVNKDITTVASQLIATWVTENVSASTALPETATIPFLSEEERTGNPWCIVNNDGNIDENVEEHSVFQENDDIENEVLVQSATTRKW